MPPPVSALQDASCSVSSFLCSAEYSPQIGWPESRPAGNMDSEWMDAFCGSKFWALSSFLVALSVADLAYAVSRTTHSYAVYPVHYCTPIITAATMALVAVLQFYNKKRGLRTSGLLFMFWFCLALLGAVEFRYQIRAAQSDVSIFHVYISCDGCGVQIPDTCGAE
uniref:ABC transporter TMD0 domain-containing protein n=1 Tax=Timema cristinae TaxID=61476 RepID=A0A7R9GX65_TIMCR|nr:unnamed protein product [Timema cristinae]